MYARLLISFIAIKIKCERNEYNHGIGAVALRLVIAQLSVFHTLPTVAVENRILSAKCVNADNLYIKQKS